MSADLVASLKVLDLSDASMIIYRTNTPNYAKDLREFTKKLDEVCNARGIKVIVAVLPPDESIEVLNEAQMAEKGWIRRSEA